MKFQLLFVNDANKSSAQNFFTALFQWTINIIYNVLDFVSFKKINVSNLHMVMPI